MELQEVWKPVVGYEGLYEVSNYGNLASLNYRNTGKWHLLKPGIDKDGYQQVVLWKDGEIKFKFVHHLVAEAFPEICGEWFEGAEIDHINAVRDDNRASNLRWCTRKENINNPITKKRHINRTDKSKPVIQFTKDGVFVAEYQSIREASRQTGINQSNITQCCLGRKRNKSAGGFVWKNKGTSPN